MERNYGKGYVKEVLEHPEATYTERITVNREEYDLAVVPRQDAEGLVIAYAEKNSNTLDDMTLESVFSDFLVNMHGVIMVCLDDTVVSTNQETLLGKTMQEMQKYHNSSLEGNESGIIRIKLDHKIWYGHKDKMKEYAIYIFFPGITDIYGTDGCLWIVHGCGNSCISAVFADQE